MPKVPDQELKAMMKYQIDQYIPMSLDEAEVDWALLGDSLRETDKYEILLTSAAKTYAEERLELVEGLGFNVIAEEPDPIAMVRALAPSDIQDARLILDMGESSTDLAVVYGGVPRLIRTIPTGLSKIVWFSKIKLYKLMWGMSRAMALATLVFTSSMVCLGRA